MYYKHHIYSGCMVWLRKWAECGLHLYMGGQRFYLSASQFQRWFCNSIQNKLPRWFSELKLIFWLKNFLETDPVHVHDAYLLKSSSCRIPTCRKVKNWCYIHVYICILYFPKLLSCICSKWIPYYKRNQLLGVVYIYHNHNKNLAYIIRHLLSCT